MLPWWSQVNLPSLKLTYIAPDFLNGWKMLGRPSFLFGELGLFSGATLLLVSGRVNVHQLRLAAAMAPKVKAGAKPTGKAKVAPKAASPEPPAPKVELEKLSVFDAETNLNFVEDEDWAALSVNEQNSDAVKKVLEAILILMGDPDTTWENAATTLQKPEVRHFLFCQSTFLSPLDF